MTFVEEFWKLLRKNLSEQYNLKIDSDIENNIEAPAVSLLNQQSILLRKRIYQYLTQQYPNFDNIINFEQFDELINQIVKLIFTIGKDI